MNKPERGEKEKEMAATASGERVGRARRYSRKRETGAMTGADERLAGVEKRRRAVAGVAEKGGGGLNLKP